MVHTSSWRKHEICWQYHHDPASALQPNWSFNVDANMGHTFGIVMAYVGSLRP